MTNSDCIHGTKCLHCRSAKRKEKLAEQQEEFNALPVAEQQKLLIQREELSTRMADKTSAFAGAIHAEAFIRSLEPEGKRKLVEQIERMIKDDSPEG